MARAMRMERSVESKPSVLRATRSSSPSSHLRPTACRAYIQIPHCRCATCAGLCHVLSGSSRAFQHLHCDSATLRCASAPARACIPSLAVKALHRVKNSTVGLVTPSNVQGRAYSR